MKKIVVIGAGTMGLDIAQVFAKAGFEVVVRDISDEIINNSEKRLLKGLDKLVQKGKLDEAGKTALVSKLSFTTALSAAADADLVIEAAVENLKIKQSIFAELDTLCKPETYPCLQHLLNLDHGHSLRDQASGQVHRHAFFQSRDGHEAR